MQNSGINPEHMYGKTTSIYEPQRASLLALPDTVPMDLNYSRIPLYS